MVHREAVGGGAASGALGRRVLADDVFEEVLALLLDGELPTGAPLSIDGLARRFDVSPTPVREALARLEATGMVRREALRGYKVAPEPTPADVLALLEARGVLETENAARASQRGAELAEELARLNGQLDEAREGGSSFAGFRAYWRADEAFHGAIARGAGNEFLLRAYGSIEGQIQRFRLMSHVGNIDGEGTVREHEAIVRAIRAGDAEGARAAMAAHLAQIARRSGCC